MLRWWFSIGQLIVKIIRYIIYILINNYQECSKWQQTLSAKKTVQIIREYWIMKIWTFTYNNHETNRQNHSQSFFSWTLTTLSARWVIPFHSISSNTAIQLWIIIIDWNMYIWVTFTTWSTKHSIISSRTRRISCVNASFTSIGDTIASVNLITFVRTSPIICQSTMVKCNGWLQSTSHWSTKYLFLTLFDPHYKYQSPFYYRNTRMWSFYLPYLQDYRSLRSKRHKTWMHLNQYDYKEWL